ncbi:MAG: hypothetical protein IPH61_03280 [Bacteroidetes bacterium]|nr:hypothetical protein [Bacteroidota bacterium]
MYLSNFSPSHHHPFGMLTPGRNWSAGSEYRFGFNGKESDAETYGEGNIYDYGFRIYNSRLGKFLSVDPLTQSYPWYTPYQFAGNKPIVAIDLDGLEEFYYGDLLKSKEGRNALFIMQATDVGVEIMKVIWSTEGTIKQRDVYFVYRAIESSNGSKNTSRQAYTTHLSAANISEDGKLIRNKYEKIDDLLPLDGIDFSASKRKGNEISVIVINTNSRGYQEAKDGNPLDLSQTIYHEIKAHIEPKINPTVSEDGTPHEKSEKQEHYNYHGNYSHYSPKPEDAKEGTPHKTYINQANKAIKNVGEYLEK